MKQMNKLKSHTRNQRRMYRIHKQEEKIHNLELLIGFLQQENQELKEQLEEINNFINKASFVNIEQLMLDYCAKVEQQKEFIEWLEECVETYERTSGCEFEIPRLILSKYKEIIGGRNGN